MKTYWTKDYSVLKCIHDDGSETAVKYSYGEGMGEGARDKYTVFLSCSVGCQQKCRFCMLTSKGVKYKELYPVTILKNAMDAIECFTSKKSEVREKAIKISWMGMGEPLLPNNISTVKMITPLLFQWNLDP